MLEFQVGGTFFDNTENFQRLLKYDAFSPYKFGARAHYCNNVEVKVAEVARKSTSTANSSHKRHTRSRRFISVLDFFSKIIKKIFHFSPFLVEFRKVTSIDIKPRLIDRQPSSLMGTRRGAPGDDLARKSGKRVTPFIKMWKMRPLTELKKEDLYVELKEGHNRFDVCSCRNSI